MKQILIRIELVLFRRSYSAVQRGPGTALATATLPVPSKGWAQKAARRKQDRSGQTWEITKWRSR